MWGKTKNPWLVAKLYQLLPDVFHFSDNLNEFEQKFLFSNFFGGDVISHKFTWNPLIKKKKKFHLPMK